MQKKRRAKWLVVVTFGAAALGACGSSGSATTGSATTGPSTGGSSSAQQIVVGNIGSYSGSQAGSIGGAELVVKAWAASVNANGGIGGRKVDLIVKDDGGNPTTALADVQALVNQDHVAAIIGDQSIADASWAPVAAKAGVPVVGGLTTELPFETNPDFFPQGTTVFATIYGTMQIAKSSAGPRFAFLYCAEAPSCAASAPLVKGLSAVAGVQVVLSQSVSATAPDYTAPCQALKASGAQAVLFGSASEVVQRFATACAQQGVTAKEVATDGTITASWLQSPALDGTLSAELDAPFSDASIPATQAFQAAIHQYAPSLGQAAGPNTTYAWDSGKLFEAAVTAGGPGPVTPSTVKAGLYTLKGATLGGLTPPLTFTPGQPTSVNCYFTLGISHGKFVTPKGLTTSCAPDAAINALLAGLKSGAAG